MTFKAREKIYKIEIYTKIILLNESCLTLSSLFIPANIDGKVVQPSRILNFCKVV